MELRQLNQGFSICKVKDFQKVDLKQEFVFVSNTDKECSAGG